MMKSADWKNVATLYSAKVMEFLLPWVYLPVVLRIIGPELFGVLALATAVSQYFLILVEFGYPFSGVRTVALLRNENNGLQTFVSTAIQLRVVIAFCSMIVVSLVVSVIDLPRSTTVVIIASCSSVLGAAFTSPFVFHGLEKFLPLSFLSIGSRFAGLVAILLLVRTESDFLLVPVIHASTGLLGGGIAVLGLFPSWGIKLTMVPIQRMMEEFHRQKGMLVSGMATSLYTATNTIILGVFTNPLIVGYYAAAEKVVRTLQQVFSPLQTLLMPQVAKEAAESAPTALARLVRLFGRLSAAIVPLCLLVGIFANDIVTTIFGDKFLPASAIVQILSPLPLIMAGTLVSTDLYLLGFGHIERWKNIINWSALSGIVLAGLSAGAFGWGAEGIAVVLLITEGMIVVRSMGSFVRELKVKAV